MYEIRKPNDSFDEGFDDVASLDEEPSIHQQKLPTDESGHIPQGTVLLMSRAKRDSEHRGLMFATMPSSEAYVETLPVHEVMFARQLSSIASGKRHEVIFERGGPGGPQAGSLNFHHWLVDQSSSITVHVGEEVPFKLDRGISGPHKFEYGGKSYAWQKTKGDEPTMGSKICRPHLECTDDEGTLYASYKHQSHSLCWRGGKEKALGIFEVKADGLESSLVEALLISMVAVWIKNQKRMLQGSQAGVAGGLGAAIAYTVMG